MRKWKWNNEHVRRIIFIALLFLILGIYGKWESDKVKKDGVWTIQTLTHRGKSNKSNVGWVGYYVYRGNRYKGVQSYYRDELRYMNPKGMRYFIQILPNNPQRRRIYDDQLPAWFTLEAPPEGWPTKPTEEELWEMMIQDGIKRGLK